MKLVYLTAGAAGMFCGSCMHDNALARALAGKGVDCVLQPLYTPIRTDEISVARSQVFFGGIEIYLLQRMPWLRFVPATLRCWLNHPAILRWATRRAGSTDPAVLGDLALSMLRGEHGRQADEVRRLVDWLESDMRPDAVVLTNLLIGGMLPTLRRRLPETKIIVLLQGDDIFLDHLPEQQRGEAIRLCSDLAESVDHFIVNSCFYGEKMSALLGIPDDRWSVHPLSIDVAEMQATPDIDGPVSSDNSSGFRLGYLARIAPEKGLHHLVDAFIELCRRNETPGIELHVAGWLGDQNRPYFDQLVRRIEEAGLSNQFFHHGSPDLNGKIRFLRSLDLLSVPTDYEDPKGLFVLEALANGVPVVQPDHGAFGELVQSTGGGLTYPCDHPDGLADTIARLRSDDDLRIELGRKGQSIVGERHTIDGAAQNLIDLIRSLQKHEHDDLPLSPESGKPAAENV
ncbi:glycosyltransferase family 4 protein [Crateriforma spongiae]|uniref:glycosyltransferase family 4 protein n=1 Tax=Crateriforma spongiae TaxID=2724528 RepID=UPI001444E2BD|nr:glycosyltransferase family 4 protein [Crateriforma spongiae]